MAFGFPAFHVAETTLTGDEASNHAVVNAAVSGLTWRVREEDADSVTASSSMDMLSWGERITIKGLVSGNVTLRSECSLPTQCFDWGKNKRNVDKLLTEITKRAHPAANPPPVVASPSETAPPEPGPVS